jgi:hypothetical protein
MSFAEPRENGSGIPENNRLSHTVTGAKCRTPHCQTAFNPLGSVLFISRTKHLLYVSPAWPPTARCFTDNRYAG